MGFDDAILIDAASKPLKPFQGLKHCQERFMERDAIASKPLKPFQGLKLRLGWLWNHAL